MVGTSGEVEFRGRGFCGIAIAWAYVSRADCPDTVDRERLSGRILQQSIELAGGQVIGCDKAAGLRSAAASKLSDQQIVAEASEIEWSQCHTPRSIEPIAMLEAPQKLPGGAVNIDMAQPRAVGFKRLSFLMERIGNDNVV